jgi:hypothetical protein
MQIALDRIAARHSTKKKTHCIRNGIVSARQNTTMPLSTSNLDVDTCSVRAIAPSKPTPKEASKMNTLARCRCAIALALLGILSAYGRSIPSISQPAAASPNTKKTYQNLVGFAQIGAESKWRTANIRWIQETTNYLGIEKPGDFMRARGKEVIETFLRLTLHN